MLILLRLLWLFISCWYRLHNSVASAMQWSWLGLTEGHSVAMNICTQAAQMVLAMFRWAVELMAWQLIFPISWVNIVASSIENFEAVFYIHTVCVCNYLSHSYSIKHQFASVSVSVCEHSHGRISWSIFTKIGTDVKTPKRKNEFVGGQYPTTPSPFCPTKTPF